jgi:hypothetical protein
MRSIFSLPTAQALSCMSNRVRSRLPLPSLKIMALRRAARRIRHHAHLTTCDQMRERTPDGRGLEYACSKSPGTAAGRGLFGGGDVVGDPVEIRA